MNRAPSGRYYNVCKSRESGAPVRKLLNKVLSRVGYELVKIDEFEKRLNWLLRQGVKFVQVGANDGVRFDSLYSKVTAHRCAGLVIEPLPDLFARLKANYADYPSVVAVNKAIHSGAQRMTMYRASQRAVDSLAEWMSGIASFDRRHLVKHGVPESHIIEESVECDSLMNILESKSFLDANVLQVDVEGYDAEIIGGIDFSRFKPRLLKYEHKNLAVESRNLTEQRLRSVGYKIWRGAEDTVAWLV